MSPAPVRSEAKATWRPVAGTAIKSVEASPVCGKSVVVNVRLISACVGPGVGRDRYTGEAVSSIMLWQAASPDNTRATTTISK
jgi:hypothetical protein